MQQPGTHKSSGPPAFPWPRPMVNQWRNYASVHGPCCLQRPPETMLMTVIGAAAEHHVDVCDPCCGQKPCWCSWSVLPLEVTLSQWWSSCSVVLLEVMLETVWKFMICAGAGCYRHGSFFAVICMTVDSLLRIRDMKVSVSPPPPRRNSSGRKLLKRVFNWAEVAEV